MSEFTRSVAVVVGINKYQNGISKLHTATEDATELSRILTETYNYEVVRLLDEEATLENLKQLLLETLPNKIRPTEEDRVLFYFAGHGTALNSEDGPTGYLVPQNAKPEARDTFLPMQELHNALTSLECRHLLTILDCCFAGAFRWSSTRDLLAAPEVIHKERYDRFVKDAAWQVITSAAHDQKALDILLDNRGVSARDAKHSPFAEALFEAFQGGADLIPDGIITATELYLYLRDHVEIRADERQTPGLWPLKKHRKGEYIFLLPSYNSDNLPPAPELNERNNPYRGLESYDEKHSSLFFGRNELVESLYSRICDHQLTVVLGVSGSGKSSIVKAGLIPYLRQDKYAKQWHILDPIRPGESPFTALARTIVPISQVAAASDIDSINQLSRNLQQEPQKFIDIVAAWSKDKPNIRLLLVIDQFEELITQCQDDEERQQFLGLLDKALAAHPQQLCIVLTLRSDFEPRFLDSPLKSHWMQARFAVRAMRSDELRQAIEGPASERVLYFEPPNLVDQLIDEVGQMPGALPLLSFTLSELYIKYLKRKSDDRALTEKDYKELGGVAGSLTNRATEEYEKLDKAHQVTMRRVMLRMVTIEGGESARRRVPLSELVYPDDAENKRVEQVIKRLSEARLIVGGQETGGEPYVEPAHDALVRGWEKLQEWKQQEQGNLALQQRLTPAANDWHKNNRETEYLWIRDPRLALLEKVLESKDDNWLNQLEMKFVRNSIQKRQDELKLAEERRQAALARQLSAQAELVRSQQAKLLPLSILLGLESLKRFPSLEADQFLRRGLSLTPRFTQPIVHNSSVRVLALSPDGKYIATVSTEISFDSEGNYIPSSDDFKQQIRISEVATGKLVQCLSRRCSRVVSEEYQGIRAVIFSPPDGKYIVTISVEETTQVQIWELATGEEVAKVSLEYSAPKYILESNDIIIPDHVWNEARAIAFSSDGKYLAIASEDSTQEPDRWEAKTRSSTSSNGSSYTAQIRRSNNAKQVRIWELAENREIAVWRQTSIVDAITFNADKQSFYVAGTSPNDSTQVKVWEVVTGHVVAIMPHSNSASTITFSPNGQYLATMNSGNDRLIQVWEVSNSREVTRISCSDSVVAVAFSSDGKYLVTVSGCQFTNDYIAQAWDVNGNPGDRTGNSALEIARVLYHADLVSGRAAAMSAGGKYLATASSMQAWVWEVMRTEAVARMPLKPEVNTIAFSSDGSYLIAAGTNSGDNQQIHLWEAATGDLVATLAQPDNLYAVALSHGGQYLVSAVGQESSCIEIWSVREQKLVEKMPLDCKVSALAFGLDGKCLYLTVAATDDSVVNVAEQETDEPDFEGESYDSLLQAASRGAYDFLLQAATPTQQNALYLEVCEATTRQVVASIPHVSGMWNPVALSPDGRYVATAKVDETQEFIELQMWDVATSQEMKSLRPRNLMPLRAITLSPSGTHLATLGVDTNAVIQVWEIASGQEIARIEAEGYVITMALGQRYLATVSHSFMSENRFMQVWPWKPEALINEACTRLTRNLTPEEWQQYLPDDPYCQTCPTQPV